MKVRAATVSVAGIAALAASAMLAGCGSGSKTASSSSASAASTAASSAESAPSTATDTARKITLTLPEIPGWTDDAKTDPDMLAAIKHGDDAGINVFAATLKKGDDLAQNVRDAVTGDSTVGGGCKTGDPAPATMSGYSGLLSTCLGEQISKERAAFGVPETADAPASLVLITGLSANSFFDQVKEALNQIVEEGTIVP